EAAEDPQFLMAMRKANIKGALVGVEAVTAEGLKSVYKDFNRSGEDLVERLQRFREHGVYVLGSFIFGLSSDREEPFDATLQLARKLGTLCLRYVLQRQAHSHFHLKTLPPDVCQYRHRH